MGRCLYICIYAYVYCFSSAFNQNVDFLSLLFLNVKSIKHNTPALIVSQLKHYVYVQYSTITSIFPFPFELEFESLNYHVFYPVRFFILLFFSLKTEMVDTENLFIERFDFDPVHVLWTYVWYRETEAKQLIV